MNKTTKKNKLDSSPQIVCRHDYKVKGEKKCWFGNETLTCIEHTYQSWQTKT